MRRLTVYGIRHLEILIVTFLISFCLSSPASAVPSFARQTGLGCNACHTMFPELTAFGRAFKLNGYTMVTGDTKTINSVNKQTEQILKLVGIGPLSAMFQTSYTHLQKKQPGTQNDNIDFPQQMSLFLAGEIAPRLGTFIQATYSQEDGKISLDNTDVRYADLTTVGSEGGQSLVYGVTVNNNPTVEDLWNTTPAWGYPYATSQEAVGSIAGTQIEGALAQRVMGIGAYSMFDGWLYASVGGYRSADQGAPNPPNGTDSTNTIQGVSPYWRVALQHQWTDQYLEVGTFGLETHQYPKGVSGPTDKFTDIGFDSQYEQKLWGGMWVSHASWIYEHQNPDATFGGGGSARSTEYLDSFKVNTAYYFEQPFAVSVGYFDTYGSSDATLYAPNAVTGSRVGKPDTDGFVAEVDYTPWLNTKIGLQYTFYDKFNGATSNYDGSGRSASSNNVLYLMGWLAF